MLQFIQIILATLFILVFSDLWANAEPKKLPELIWILPEFPPYYTSITKSDDSGIHNQIERYLTKKMSRYYKVSRIESNINRVVRYFTNPKLKAVYCVPGGPISTAPMLNYGAQTMFKTHPAGLLRRKNNDNFSFTKDGHIDINKTLIEKDAKLAIFDKGHFGKRVDIVIQNHIKKVVKIPSTNTTQALRLVLKGRVDGFFIYPFNYSHLQKSHPEINTKDLILNPINEEQNPQKIHLICEKSPSGQKALKRLDRLVQEPEFKKILKKILAPYQ